MTRINVGIPPHTLHDKHLLAEHREMVRIPNLVRKKLEAGKPFAIPAVFNLGRGHVTFFYNKLGYLQSRYFRVHAECKRRGFNVTDFSSAFAHLPSEFFQDYKPTDRDRSIIQERINQRLKEMKVK